MNLSLRPKNWRYLSPLLRTLAIVVAAVGAVAGVAGTASADLYAKVVVIGVPGLTWGDVQGSPELTALVNQ